MLNVPGNPLNSGLKDLTLGLETLKEILAGLETSTPRSDDYDIKTMLHQVLDEVKAIRAERTSIQKDINELQKKLADQDEQISDLKICNQNMLKAVEFHQRMLEQLDSKERACNVVVTELKEDIPFEGAVTDQEKCSKIFEKIEVDVEFQAIRLGKKDQYPRPILVMTKTPEDRKLLLDNAKKLKDAGDIYTAIYVKKDTNPGVSREWKRLRESEKREKDKEENAGCEIKLDYRKRLLLKDGITIDRWQPSFFH